MPACDVVGAKIEGTLSLKHGVDSVLTYVWSEGKWSVTQLLGPASTPISVMFGICPSGPQVHCAVQFWFWKWIETWIYLRNPQSGILDGPSSVWNCSPTYFLGMRDMNGYEWYEDWLFQASCFGQRLGPFFFAAGCHGSNMRRLCGLDAFASCSAPWLPVWFTELDDGKMLTGKPLKTMVFCRFSLEPIQWLVS